MKRGRDAAAAWGWGRARPCLPGRKRKSGPGQILGAAAACESLSQPRGVPFGWVSLQSWAEWRQGLGAACGDEPRFGLVYISLASIGDLDPEQGSGQWTTMPTLVLSWPFRSTDFIFAPHLEAILSNPFSWRNYKRKVCGMHYTPCLWL